MLTYHILKQAGLDVGLAGNIGKSLALQVAEEPHGIYVIELSSFQLDNMYEFKADIAILLNITPDHLDRYEHKMENYAAAKFRILQNQTKCDAFIFWNDDPIIRNRLVAGKPESALYPFSEKGEEGVRGYTENGKFLLKVSDKIDFEMELEHLSLPGLHNLYNSLAAGLAAKLMGVRNDVIRKSLSDFPGVEHRLEKVATISGVTYVNDSKATNVDSCWYALEKVRALVFLGVDNSKLHAFFDGKIGLISDASSMQECIDKARAFAEKGDTVLLSPCCASFDLFKSYEDRGAQFKECVHKLL